MLVYIYYDEFYINFSLLEAFQTTIIICTPWFIINLCLYKYGGKKKLNKYAERVMKNKKK
ncbi:hypothetical protein THUN1657_14650 [Rodentibacter abscessus]